MKENRTTKLLRVASETVDEVEEYCKPINVPTGHFYTIAAIEKLKRIMSIRAPKKKK